MSRPRTSIKRELFGILGDCRQTNKIQKEWNDKFDTKKIDAFMDRYKTGKNDLSLRLSEMFHFDRRGYIVYGELQKNIIPLLDIIDYSVGKTGKVDTVLNKGGVLMGYFLGDDMEERWRLWLEE